MAEFNRESAFCEKENIKCLCAKCPENKTKHNDGNCDGCKDCGKKTNARCLVI